MWGGGFVHPGHCDGVQVSAVLPLPPLLQPGVAGPGQADGAGLAQLLPAPAAAGAGGLGGHLEPDTALGGVHRHLARGRDSPGHRPGPLAGAPALLTEVFHHGLHTGTLWGGGGGGGATLPLVVAGPACLSFVWRELNTGLHVTGGLNLDRVTASLSVHGSVLSSYFAGVQTTTGRCGHPVIVSLTTAGPATLHATLPGQRGAEEERKYFSEDCRPVWPHHHLAGQRFLMFP